MITISINLQTDLTIAWDCWTNPLHIINWNFASADWCCPKATNNLVIGGKFSYTMADKNSEMRFDFSGIYTKIEYLKIINYTTDDNRLVEINFSEKDNLVTIIQKFEHENVHPKDFQKNGWQAILDNFKKYVETI